MDLILSTPSTLHIKFILWEQLSPPSWTLALSSHSWVSCDSLGRINLLKPHLQPLLLSEALWWGWPSSPVPIISSHREIGNILDSNQVQSSSLTQGLHGHLGLPPLWCSIFWGQTQAWDMIQAAPSPIWCPQTCRLSWLLYSPCIVHFPQPSYIFCRGLLLSHKCQYTVYSTGWTSPSTESTGTIGVSKHLTRLVFVPTIREPWLAPRGWVQTMARMSKVSEYPTTGSPMLAG